MPTYAQYLSGGLGQPRRASVAPQFSGSSLGIGGQFGGQLGSNPGSGNRAEFDKLWQSTGAAGDMGPGSFMRNRLLQDWVNAGPSAWGQVPPGLERFFRRRGAPSMPIGGGSTAYSAAGSPYGVGMFSQPGVGSFLSDFNVQLQQPSAPRLPTISARPRLGAYQPPVNLGDYMRPSRSGSSNVVGLPPMYRSPYGF